jgi:drug/metabolite transporter (DMT)-like permease
MKKQSIWPIAALVGASILWGLNPPLIKVGLETVPVPIHISIKFMMAALILLPLAIKRWKPLSFKDMCLLITSSIIFNSMASTALSLGLTRTTSINAGIFALLAPLMLFAFSVAFLKEKMRMGALIGTLVALAGSLIIVGLPWVSIHPADTSGILLILLSDCCWAIGTLLFKPLIKKTSAYQAVFSTFFFGTIPVALFALTRLDTWDMQATSQASIMAMSCSLVAIIGANFLFFYGLRHKAVQTIGLYDYIQPIVTIIAAWFILSERPSLNFALGASLVFLGLYISEFVGISKKSLRYAPRRNIESQ